MTALVTEARNPTRYRRRWLLIVCLGLLTVGAALLFRGYVAQIYAVPSASMQETVHPGERVAVEKLSYLMRAPTRGEVIVFDGHGFFDDPAPGEHIFVKRVVGVGGDRVACCDAQGRITVNGTSIDESEYLGPGDSPSEVRFDVQVPPDSLWVMGDHRSASADSRKYIGAPGGGFVPVSRVLGRATAVVWPMSSIHAIGLPGTFAQADSNNP